MACMTAEPVCQRPVMRTASSSDDGVMERFGGLRRAYQDGTNNWKLEENSFECICDGWKRKERRDEATRAAKLSNSS